MGGTLLVLPELEVRGPSALEEDHVLRLLEGRQFVRSPLPTPRRASTPALLPSHGVGRKGRGGKQAAGQATKKWSFFLPKAGLEDTVWKYEFVCNSAARGGRGGG